MKLKLPKIPVPGFVTKAVSTVSRKTVKYRPEIALGIGIAAVIGGTVAACMASRKVDAVLEEADMNLAKIHDEAETDQTVTESDTRKALAKEYVRICWQMVKLYGPSVLLLTGGIISICGSHVEMKNRNTALTAAYTSLGNAFAAYKDKVIEKLGPEEEEKLRLGVEKESREVTEMNDNGEVETRVNELYSKVADPNSPFAIYFDETTSKLWERSSDYNWTLITQEEASAQRQFDAQGKGGFYCLMDILDHLGMHHVVYKPEYKHFLTAGWVQGHGEDRISFNAREVQVSSHDRFGNPIMETKILLEFNCNKEPVWMNL